MGKTKFTGYWFSGWYKQFNIPKGFMIIKCDDRYHDVVKQNLIKLDSKQKKRIADSKNYLIPIDFTLDPIYGKRSLDQNALMWSLYEIEANEHNGGMSGNIDQNVTSKDLYYADLLENGEREKIKTSAANFEFYNSEYYILSIYYDGTDYDLESFNQVQVDIDSKLTINFIRGSSKFNIMEMKKWIDRLFNRLAHMGVSFENSSEIGDYWIKWSQYKNDKKLTISNDIMTKDEYRENNPSCEACGKFIVGSGHLAHIKAFGMGAVRSKELTNNYTFNWLHLCNKCHLELQHQKGWDTTLKKYPHLKFKVESALKRDFSPIGIDITDDTKDLDLF